MISRRAVVALAALVLAGCGGGGTNTTIQGVSGPASRVPGGADAGDVNVIDGWVTTLRKGDVRRAARYFAIPSVAENPPALIHIRSLRDAVRFNRSLPCGARLVRAVSQGEFTTATFRLTERPGPGVCGAGTGARAKTAFVIRDGKIVQWRRVGVRGGGGGGGGQSV